MSNLASACANASASTYGAPTSSKTRVVPLPSDIWVPSRCTLPGNTVVVSTVGMFGDGRTQGPSVSSYQSSRDQPDILTHFSSLSIAKYSLNIRPNSQKVIPCLVAIGNCPTNDAKAGSRTTPATFVPPIGFGRSQAITFFPNFFAARMQLARVYTNV